MNTSLNNNESWFAKCKRIFLEQLWLIFLLAPLLIIAFFINKHYQPINHKVMLSQHNANLSVSVEITSAELAMIVAKPIGELLAMEVYIDYKQASRPSLLTTSIDNGSNLGNEVYNRIALKSNSMHLYAKN